MTVLMLAAFTAVSGATCVEPPSFDFKEVPKAVRPLVSIELPKSVKF